MIVKTGRFGQLGVENDEMIYIPQGILGFPDYKRFFIVDPGDDTFILWLQAVDHADLAFPILEPKIFKPDYTVRLSALELRELKLENINQSAVFSILTIPESVTQMTANLKAPLVINLKEQVAKQVVLQENEYSIQHEMFKELKMHLLSVHARRVNSPSSHLSSAQGKEQSQAVSGSPVSVRNIPPSLTVRTLHPTA
ncbi:MAG: flagellar assembly protein FliW [Bdellovibrionia bacterium]